MIFESLSYIAKELNQSINSKLKVNQDMVILSSILSQDGSVPIEAEDKILLTLVNVEQETNVPKYVSASLISKSTPMYFNLYVMFTAAFRNSIYDESLKFLSFVIGYFQSNRSFTRSNFSSLPNGVEQLNFEIVNQGLQEMHNLWGAMGAKYQPSILYKIRVLTFDEGSISRINVAIKGLDAEGAVKPN